MKKSYFNQIYLKFKNIYSIYLSKHMHLQIEFIEEAMFKNNMNNPCKKFSVWIGSYLKQYEFWDIVSPQFWEILRLSGFKLSILKAFLARCLLPKY